MQIYCKSCKKDTKKHFQKKLVLISKNIIKEKSKCAICLTERTFIYQIEDKYDLERKIKVYLKLFTDRCYKRKWRLIA